MLVLAYGCRIVSRRGFLPSVFLASYAGQIDFATDPGDRNLRRVHRIGSSARVEGGIPSECYQMDRQGSAPVRPRHDARGYGSVAAEQGSQGVSKHGRPVSSKLVSRRVQGQAEDFSQLVHVG